MSSELSSVAYTFILLTYVTPSSPISPSVSNFGQFMGSEITYFPETLFALPALSITVNMFSSLNSPISGEKKN